MTTHDVVNQPPPFADVNLFRADRALRDALAHHAPDLDPSRLDTVGAHAGAAATIAHARLANRHAPELHTHDVQGRRIDAVEFHPSYDALLGAAIGHGLHGTPWGHGDRGTPWGQGDQGTPRPGGRHAHLERAAGFLLATQAEPSVLCPVSMTYAVTPALRANAAVAADWLPHLADTRYDGRSVPFAAKPAVTMGMGMTEKQGGSDVRANTTRAEPDGTDGWGDRYAVTGHKWFFSAPMSDAHLVLAQAPQGLTCFFLPRLLPDGSANAVRIQRLKSKLGNHANASAEVEFDRAAAWLVGEPGRGIPQILAMGALTRLDCALGTAGLMRHATSLALHHCAHRSAFGRPLVEQPAMRNVLADLALESEAATALALRLAAAVDRTESGAGDDHERALRRLLTPLAKFWVCKRGSHLAQEAMECLGGNGYVEADGAGVMARIYREMPLNSIWEGAANVMALDLLRALRSGDAVAAVQRELDCTRGAHAALDRTAARVLDRADAAVDERDARALARELALALQASLLRRHSNDAVFDAFCASRLDAAADVFGLLPARADLDAIIRRAAPLEPA